MKDGTVSTSLIATGILTLALTIGLLQSQDANAQGRQRYPNVHEEEYIEVSPGEKYNCPECKMVFQGTEFTVWEHSDGNRVVVAVPIMDNTTFRDESFIYNYCFTGIKHVIPGQCDDPEYEQYKIE